MMPKYINTLVNLGKSKRSTSQNYKRLENVQDVISLVFTLQVRWTYSHLYSIIKHGIIYLDCAITSLSMFKAALLYYWVLSIPVQ